MQSDRLAATVHGVQAALQSCRRVAQPVAQRAAYLLRLHPKLADLTGLQKPIIELGDAA